MRDFPRSDEKNSAALRVLIRWSVSETLADRGYAVVETGDAKGARSAVDADHDFDVVLLDYRLPDSDDLSLLASIRRAAPLAQVILMTAFGRPDVVHGALELGAYRVVNKPFELDAMADLVAQASAARACGKAH